MLTERLCTAHESILALAGRVGNSIDNNRSAVCLRTAAYSNLLLKCCASCELKANFMRGAIKSYIRNAVCSCFRAGCVLFKAIMRSKTGQYMDARCRAMILLSQISLP